MRSSAASANRTRRSMRSLVAVVALSTASMTTLVTGSEPNPPKWDTEHVKILDPDDEGACDKLSQELIAEMGGGCHHGEFSDSRYAVFLKPGHHRCKFDVGFYTTLLGVGRRPTDARIDAVQSADSCGSALDNFWRGIENFSTGYNGTVEWHVSQAAPMRRVHVNTTIRLGTGWSSGGYMSNCKVDAHVDAGSQQQWFSRNNEMTGWNWGAWSFVHLGCVGAPPTTCDRKNWGYLPAHTNLPKTPIVAEKPYVVLNDDGVTYDLVVPGYERNKVGHNWNGPEKEIPFDKVYVASDKDDAAKINEKLKNEVDHVLLQPGQYEFDEPIRLDKDFQVVLGVGMPTLKSTRGNSLVEVGNTKGVRVSGMILEPGTNTPGPHLLRWGTDTRVGDRNHPGVMSDVFARVGGRNNSTVEERQIDAMVEINNSHVIIDHTWLWRADHDVAGLVRKSRNHVAHGLVVNGHHVRAYGLFVEHTLGDLLRWNGEDGEVYMYQSELPYDVSQRNYADRGFHSYRIDDKVRRHKSYGTGVYSYFRDHDVKMDTGIVTPGGTEIRFTNAFIKQLNGFGGLDHVLNDQGGSAYDFGIAYLCGEHVAVSTRLSSLAKAGFAAARLH